MSEDYMDIYSPPGTRVKFSHPTAGYQYDQKLARENLTVGNVYVVEYTEVGSCHTAVYLKGFGNKRFNSVMFEEA